MRFNSTIWRSDPYPNHIRILIVMGHVPTRRLYSMSDTQEDCKRYPSQICNPHQVKNSVQGYPSIKQFVSVTLFFCIIHLLLLSDNLDESNEEGVDGEEVGEDADDVDEDAVVDKEMDLPPDLPHVQTNDTFLQCTMR